MKNLKLLDLTGNYLSTLPNKLEKLINLETLILNDNHFESIPPVIGCLPSLKNLSFYNNSIATPPPEIINRGVESIKYYLSAIYSNSSSSKKVYEAKLIIVGQGGVGKTSITSRLVNNYFNKIESKTKGIEIKNWKISSPDDSGTEILINIWDFGGQEIYHATHQFFLTHRSAYLLVWDARQESEHGRLDYWLHTIESFSDDSPVILILNKLDEHNSDINLCDLKEKFPQISGFFKVSCQNPDMGQDSFESLEHRLSEIIWSLPFMGSDWPHSWFLARKEIEKIDSEKITYDHFRKICIQNKVNDSSILVFSQFLHDLGVVLHFQDDIKLKEIVILKPEWATNAVYKVLESREVSQNQGILTENLLPKIWKKEDGYPKSTYDTLLRLMANFQLSFHIPGTNNDYLVAELLSSAPAHFDWEDDDDLVFYYEYDFMPAGIMPRFNVLIHALLCKDKNGNYLCWRHGSILRKENSLNDIDITSYAYVRERNYDNLIEIRVHGDRKRDLLTIIRNEFDKINNSINKVAVSRLVPCICSVNCPQKYSYDALLKKEKKRVDNVNCDQSARDVSITKLLDGIESNLFERVGISPEQASTNYIVNKGIIMGDNYTAKQAGTITMGPGSTTLNIDFNQVWSDFEKENTSESLLDELKTLRVKLKELSSTPEHDIAVGNAAQAEGALNKSDGPKAMEYLSKVGKWGIEVSQKIGLKLAEAIIKASIGQ